MMERPEESNILVVEGINKSFGGVHALNDVNLQIARGEIHCLAGENGSGKSTLIKLISGVYKPDSGKIIMDGKTYDSLTTQEAINAGVQVIYQDFSIFPNLSVIENIAFNQALRKKRRFVNKKEFREIAERALSKINIEIDLDARMEELPVADKQLVAIARALLDDSRLLIMDEPTSGLDPVSRDELLDVFREFVADGKRSILFSTHITSDLDKCADYIMYIKDGCILMNGDREEIIGGYRLVCGGKADMTPELEAALIGVKETAFGFTGLIAERDLNAADGLQTAPADIESIMLYTEKYELHQEA